jgi:hypothetical protein
MTEELTRRREGTVESSTQRPFNKERRERESSRRLAAAQQPHGYTYEGPLHGCARKWYDRVKRGIGLPTPKLPHLYAASNG